MKLRIVIRTRTPWSTMTMADFLAQKDPRKPTEFFRIGKKVLPVWEKATGRNFFLYRELVQRACRTELEKTGLPISYADEIDWNSEDEGLIPIDDDDILFPSIATIAERFTDEINLITWVRITNYLGSERVENPDYGGQIDTCNCAIRKSFLNQLSMPERISVLSRHWHAAQTMAHKLGGPPVPTSLLERAIAGLKPMANGVKLNHPSVLHLNERHSVYFLHSASISFLNYKIAKHTDERGMVDYIKSLPLHPLCTH